LFAYVETHGYGVFFHDVEALLDIYSGCQDGGFFSLYLFPSPLEQSALGLEVLQFALLYIHFLLIPLLITRLFFIPV